VRRSARSPFEADLQAVSETAKPSIRAAGTFEQETFAQAYQSKNFCVVGLGRVLVTFVLFARVKFLFAVGLGLELAKSVPVPQVKAPCVVCHDHVWEKGVSSRHHPVRCRAVACEILSSQAKELWWKMVAPVSRNSICLGDLAQPVVGWHPMLAVLFSLQAM
jgi:hypothetical protein